MSKKFPSLQSVSPEIGSYFHWVDEKEYAKLANNHPAEFDEKYNLFYSGRHAVKYLLNLIDDKKPINKIWMPEYYCQHVANWMKKNYSNLSFYQTHPFKFDSEFTLPNGLQENDVIIINNYWGLTTTEVKDRKGFEGTIIEDHSHAWLSSQSITSNADYCFVSLRKSLPIPLGGICWKPGGELPKVDSPTNKQLYQTWDLMVKAMRTKSEYFNNPNTIDKSIYLKQISDVEDGLDVSLDIVKLRKKDIELIQNFIILDILKIKKKNLVYLHKRIQENDSYNVIKRNGYTAFGLMLLFNNDDQYSSFRSFLIQHGIFASNLWPNNKKWKHFLNIHVDFRYNKTDMDYILEVIQDWNLRQ